MAIRSRSLEPKERGRDGITAAVIEHWRTFGLPGTLVWSIPNEGAKGQPGLTEGIPDLGVWTPWLGDKTGFIEIKRIGGRLSPAQKEIRDRYLAPLRIPYAVCWGRNEPIRQLELWGAVRETR